MHRVHRAITKTGRRGFFYVRVIASQDNLPQAKPEVKPTSSSNATGDTATIDTKFGQISIKLLDNVAPKTVSNFEKCNPSNRVSLINLPQFDPNSFEPFALLLL